MDFVHGMSIRAVVHCDDGDVGIIRDRGRVWFSTVALSRLRHRFALFGTPVLDSKAHRGRTRLNGRPVSRDHSAEAATEHLGPDHRFLEDLHRRTEVVDYGSLRRGVDDHVTHPEALHQTLYGTAGLLAAEPVSADFTD